jgi:excinuclease UvrABC helicase subunit UvrB
MSKMSTQNHYQPKATIKLNTTATSAVTSSSIGDQINVVRLAATQACYVKFGNTTAITATSSDMYIPANVPEYFSIPVGGARYVAAIRVSVDGVLDITEMTQ